jgi:hypothetical protein
MTKTLKIMVQVEGQQVTDMRKLPMQPANKTEVEYYTDMAVRMLHEAMDGYEKDKAREPAKAAK